MKKAISLTLAMITLVCLLTACAQNPAGTSTQASCTHQWENATCDAAKSCKLCGETEGEALGHDWEDATTQTAKRCRRCYITEGNPIETDDRFITAACSRLFGTWSCEMTVSCGKRLTAYHCQEQMHYTLQLTFRNDGTLAAVIEVADRDAFITHLCGHTEAMLYAQLEAEGYSKEEADANMMATLNMTVAQYAAVLVDEMGIQDDFDGELVYYVNGVYLYMADHWDEEMTDVDFKVEDGVLKISRNGVSWQEFTKVVE